MGSAEDRQLEATATFRSALARPGFPQMLTAHGLGTVAQLMLTMAVGIAVLEQTGSGVWTSLVVAFGFVPYVVFSGLAGVVADRYPRSSVLRWSLAARALLSLLLTAGVILGMPFWLVLLALAAAAVIATPSYPALAAATPQLVEDEQLPPANALVTSVENSTWVAGPGLTGVILLLGGPISAVPAVATVLFATAAVTVHGIHLPKPGQSDDREGTWRELVAGLQVVLTELRVRSAMGYAICDNFLYGYLVVAILLVATELLAEGETGIGWLNASLTIGTFAAIAVTNRLAASRRVRSVLVSQIAILAGGIGLLAVAPNLTVAVAIVFVAGGACLIAEVVAVTLLQRSAPEEVCARVFGVYDQLNVGAIAVGSAIAGPLAEAIGLAPSLILVAGVAGTFGVLSAFRVGYHVNEANGVPVSLAV